MREPQPPLSFTERSASFHARAAPVALLAVVLVAVAQWVWFGLIFAVVLLGVAALARRA